MTRASAWVCPNCPRTWSGPSAEDAVDRHWQRTSHAPYLIASLSPDCEQAKHTACSGDAWDHDTDSPAACQCLCHIEIRR